MSTIFIKNSFTFLASTVTVVSHFKACLKALRLEDGNDVQLYCFMQHLLRIYLVFSLLQI